MSARPVTHEDLVLHALGRLGPRRREEVVAALKGDAALAREAEQIARHLALYERLPAPPEPPAFAQVAARLGPQRAHRNDPLRVFRRVMVGSFAAMLVLGVGVFLAGGFDPRPRRQPWPVTQPVVAGAGAIADGPGGYQAPADGPVELRLAERARVVLDAGARLDVDHDGLPELEGRAWFEVAPGPFVLTTDHGSVEVLGTKFEVDTREGLLVRVVEGRVRALGREAGPGETIASGDAAVEGLPGAFARRPRLEAAVRPADDGTWDVTLTFVAPRHVAVEVPGPHTGSAAAWLALTHPDGSTTTVGLDLAGAGAGAPQPGRLFGLAAGDRRPVHFRVPRPPGAPGLWRLAALYRPEGEAALASEPLPLEVR